MTRRRATKANDRRGRRVIPYLRVSSVGDRGDDLISPDVQANECRRLCEREGLVMMGEGPC